MLIAEPCERSYRRQGDLMRTHCPFMAVLATVVLLAIGAAPVVAAAPESGAPALAWQALLGGSGGDHGYSVQPTADGGYVLVGESSSSASGNVTGTNHGATDVWVVKLNSAGAVQWDRLLGGSSVEYAKSIEPTADGGYLLLAESDSSRSGDVTGTNHGYRDLWVVKLNGMGEVQWQELLGGSGNEYGAEVQQTSDGGYVLVGSSTSSANGTVTWTTHGNTDVWVVKLNSAGAVQWDRLLGGTLSEYGFSVRQAPGGGYILLGSSASSRSGLVTGTNHGQEGTHDFWVVKLTGTGAIEWDRLLGGAGWDEGYSVRTTTDGGYVLAGYSDSSGTGDVAGANHGIDDVWMVKLNGTGTIEWENLLGGSKYDSGNAVRQTADGGYVLVGESYSSASGDVTGTNHGSEDVWLVKVNRTGSIEWNRLLGGSGLDIGTSVLPTPDGAYVLVGHSSSSLSGNVTGTNHGGDDVWVLTVKVEPTQIPGGTGIPRDPDGNARYTDVNGNGRKDFEDIVLYFNQMTWIAANEPVAAFDYNANGRIDFADVVWLFNHL